MSASREKKQRQSAGQNLTQKELKEAKEAQAAKRKSILYWVIGVVVVILVAALLIWNSNFFQNRATAVTVNGHNFTAGEVEYYYNSAYQQEYQLYYYSTMGITGLTNFNPATDPKDQYVDEEQTQTYYDYFMESALDALTQVAALTDAAEKDGFSLELSESGKETYDSTISSMKDNATTSGYSYASYLQAIYGSHMTTGIYESCLKRAIMLTEYQQAHQDTLTYTDEDYTTYYDENKDSIDTFSYEVAFLSGSAPSTTDEDGNTVEATEEEKTAAMEAAKANADKLMADVEAGGDFAELADTYVQEDSANTFRSTETTGSSLSTTYGDWLKDAARAEGDINVFESTSGYYVVRFLDRYLDETPTADIRHILVKAELTQEDDPATEDVDESTIPTDEAMEAAKAEAESLLAQWEAGDKTAESFGELAKANSDDSGSASNGGLYTQFEEGQMVDTFNDWIFDSEHTEGDTGLVENTNSGMYGWHVMYFQAWNDPSWKINAKSSFQNDDMTSWIESITEGYEAVKADGFKYVG
ncbi:MAG: peptidylprolyl isomerase [Pseudoflavonifractor capillosus]|uniref:peptidylprolyl isomerase n=1 Tax=Pseudoflavonifractor capillosus TaxID=106588 RepID=UPI0023F79AD4|nr:peptidylprolyl isomerase [Pseudoflavonifractor capillosus]MCI5928378.1 peptidylprolyl isomerase [Pseudoflavonifractor capillosus]MDY4661114.1 peptidylprolyl isomerase [Pseudoflavonifractor capillosus]